MLKLPRIASFWNGSRLGWIERLTLASYLAKGHEVTLFAMSEVLNVPDEVNVVPYQEVLDFPIGIVGTTAPSYLADIFRLYLMKRTDMVWVDTDALCYRPFIVDNGYLVGWTPGLGEVSNGAMRVPANSAALELLIEYIENPNEIAPWMRVMHQQKLAEMDSTERLQAQYHMLRTVYGPKGLTFALRKTGEISHAQDPSVLFPVPWYMSDLFFNDHGGVDGWLTKSTLSVHLYTAQIRKWHKNHEVPSSSFLGRFMKELDFEI